MLDYWGRVRVPGLSVPSFLLAIVPVDCLLRRELDYHRKDPAEAGVFMLFVLPQDCVVSDNRCGK